MRYIGEKLRFKNMLKIIVFDGGWGGKIVANFLATELRIAEVTPVIDWDNAPYDEKTLTEVCRYTEKMLLPYIGKVDLIVLGGYTASFAMEYLQRRHRNQKFVGMEINYYRILKSRIYPYNIVAMMNTALIDTPLCETMRQKLSASTIFIPDCSGWEDLANKGALSMKKMRADLESYFELAPEGKCYDDNDSDTILEKIMKEKYLSESASSHPSKPSGLPLVRSNVVLLLNTNFWELREDIEKLFGYNVRVLDFRQKLLHDVCAALNLLGVHGERSK